jgi:hypothetical protein
MRTRAILTVLGAAASVLFLAGPAYSQVVCMAPANCGNAGGTRTCTEMWVYGVTGYANTMASPTGAATSCTVMGNLATRTFVAMRPTAAAATAGCNFAGNFNTLGFTFPYTCTIDTAGGLPVELMDFSIDDEKPKD